MTGPVPGPKMAGGGFAARAGVKLVYDWDFPGAAADFRRALTTRLDATDPELNLKEMKVTRTPQTHQGDQRIPVARGPASPDEVS